MNMSLLFKIPKKTPKQFRRIADKVTEMRETMKFKEELKTLIKEYRTEIAAGDYTHKNDLIAASVLIDLAYFNTKYIGQYTPSKITLQGLMNYKYDSCTIPSLEAIAVIRKKYQKAFKNPEYYYVDEVAKENAATTWFEMMILTGKRTPGESMFYIDKCKLSDYINDDRLNSIVNKAIEAYENENITIGNWHHTYLSKKNR